jgi:hypothetical protein
MKEIAMTTRERRPLDREVPAGPPSDAQETAPSGAAETGDAFLAAADAAIARALSGRSEAFLTQNRQLGGQ